MNVATQPSTRHEQVDEFWHSANRIKAGATCQKNEWKHGIGQYAQIPLNHTVIVLCHVQNDVIHLTFCHTLQPGTQLHIAGQQGLSVHQTHSERLTCILALGDMCTSGQGHLIAQGALARGTHD